MTPGEIAVTAGMVGLFGVVNPRAGYAMILILALTYIILGWTPWSGHGL